MKKSFKIISAFASILTIAVILSGCSSSNRSQSGNEKFVQTHQDDKVTHVGAQMLQATSQNGMGDIQFRERDSGLQMRVNLNNTRPNTDYRLFVYDLGCCEPNCVREAMKCDKERTDIVIPGFRSDANGNVSIAFLANNVTAAELDGKKLALTRMDANGNRVTVGKGLLKNKSWF